jgi:glutamate racemase
MDGRPVLFLDSGIGGIPYCREFKRRNPQESVFYLADRLNFPYGQRSKEELAGILISLTKTLVKAVIPKIIVLACNSATVSALESLRQNFPHIPFVGTVPAVKPAANNSRTGKVGVLGTARTIEDPYNQDLAEGKCEIKGAAAPELVEFVERRFDNADEKEKTEVVKKYVDYFRSVGADTLVLGCTHFLYLTKEFRLEAAPFIKVFDSLDGIIKRIEYLLDRNDHALRAGKKPRPVNRLLLTGNEPAGPLWKKRAEALGFKLCLFNEI